MSRSRVLLLLISGLGLAGLVSLRMVDTDTSRQPGSPVAIAVVGGADQSGEVGTELLEPLVVRVTDDEGRPVPGVSVSFDVVEGGGSLFQPAALTDAAGEAVNRWTLGPSVDSGQRIRIGALGERGGVMLEATVSARPFHGAVESVRALGGQGQPAPGGQLLEQELVIEAVDRYGNPVSGALTTWRVLRGGGEVVTFDIVTDADGRSAATWRVGHSGDQRLSVLVSREHRVTFDAFTVAQAGELFIEDFEDGLVRWTGRASGHHGELAADPFDDSNTVLRFTKPVAAGDLFSTEIPIDPRGSYVVEFDYLGLPVEGSDPENTGGFIGIADGLPGQHTWFAGTEPWGSAAPLTDDGTWHGYSIPFVPGDHLAVSGNTIRIMLEDAEVTGGVPRDAYFDNVRLIRIGGR